MEVGPLLSVVHQLQTADVGADGDVVSTVLELLRVGDELAAHRVQSAAAPSTDTTLHTVSARCGKRLKHAARLKSAATYCTCVS